MKSANRQGISRRGFVAAGMVAASAAVTSCTGVPAPEGGSRNRRRPRVSLIKQGGYTGNLYDNVRRMVAEHRIEVKGKRVVLKPNLVEFESGSAINTNPRLVHAALETFRAMGAASVRIAEGPGHRRVTLDLADAAGYFDLIPDFEQIFTDLNLDDVSRVKLSRPVSKLRELYLPNTVLGADLLVSMPKMKTHHWAVATLSMKNFFGLVPGAVYGWPKNVLHWAGIPECIADINRVVPRTFAIVDGIVGMEGNGPIQGTSRAAGILVAGRDLAAVDATCCRAMNIDPERVAYLRLSRPVSELAGEAVEQIGEAIRDARSSFELPPTFTAARLGG